LAKAERRRKLAEYSRSRLGWMESGPPLWVPFLLLGGLAGAYIWRHELAQAAHSILKLLGLAAATVPPMAAAEKDKENCDVVDASALAPTSGCAGEDVLVQIFLHVSQERGAAAVLAYEADSEARGRGLTTLTVPVQRGHRINILLEAAGVAVDEPEQSLIWR